MQIIDTSKKTLLILGLIVLLGIFFWFNQTRKKDLEPNSSQNQAKAISQNEHPKIISTKPDPLEEAVVETSEIIEISFNKALENEGEFKVRIEPKTDIKIQLSSDRKTAKIVPQKPYDLGTTYTLFIGPETKFDGMGRWGEEKVFHIKTITYRGV